MLTFRRSTLCVTLLSLCSWAMADGETCTNIPSPFNMVKSAAEVTLKNMCTGSDESPAHLVKVVRKDFMPIIDENLMSEQVVGHEAYTKANPKEQQAFTDAFIDSVFDTYASSIYSFCGADMHFYPLRGNPAKKQRVVIKSYIESDSGDQVTINYVTVREGCNWKISDLDVANISMVDSYNAQFESIAEQEGLPSLTKKLRNKLAAK